MAEAKANGFKQNLGTPVEKVFYLGDGPTPAYTAGEEMNLVAMAEARGEHWAETFLRLGRETNGKALFTLRMFNSNLDALAHMFKSDRCFPSLGDAGAHVTQVMDAGWATFVLSYWVRETGFFTLEEAVRRMTAVPARIMGLKDRGTLAVGQRADINVFDAATVAETAARAGPRLPRRRGALHPARDRLQGDPGQRPGQRARRRAYRRSRRRGAASRWLIRFGAARVRAGRTRRPPVRGKGLARLPESLRSFDLSCPRADTGPMGKEESRRLPPNPSKEHLRKQAKRLAKDKTLKLAAAQRQLAAEHGAASWAELMRRVEARCGAARCRR